MYCTFCGKQIADDAVFCPHCKKPANQSDTLAELVNAARIGDQDAISALYEKTYSLVCERTCLFVFLTHGDYQNNHITFHALL